LPFKKGHIPWNTGKKTSAATRKKISLGGKGKKRSKETKRKMSLARKGKKMSAEAKRNLSLARKGKKMSAEAKRNMSLAKKGKTNAGSFKKGQVPWSKGKKFSEESRRKMSQAKKGKPSPRKGQKLSEETKKKLSEFQKKNTKAHFKKGKENPMYGKKGSENPFFGRKHTEAARKKVSLANKGRKHTEAAKNEMSLKRKGKKLTITWRENISNSKKGKKNPMYGKTGEQSPFYGRHHTEAVKRQKSIQSKEFANRPETKEMLRKVLRRTRHNQVKPNKPEKKIKKILTDAGIEFRMFVNVKYKNLQENRIAQHECDFIISPNKIIEHNGTYDHADPRKYKSEDKIYDETAKEIWEKEEMMLNQIRAQGYEILVVWLYDLNKDFAKTRNKILKFAQGYSDIT